MKIINRLFPVKQQAIISAGLSPDILIIQYRKVFNFKLFIGYKMTNVFIGGVK
jgi:hypothetical protein